MDSLLRVFHGESQPVSPSLQAEDARSEIVRVVTPDQNISLNQSSESLSSPEKPRSVINLNKETPVTEGADHFSVTFNRSQISTDHFARDLELIYDLCRNSSLEASEKQAVTAFLTAYNQNISDLQRSQIPELSALSEGHFLKLEDNYHLYPDKLQREISKSTLTFHLCLSTDHFMFGLIDKPLLTDLVQFIQNQPDPRVEEVMAGVGWLNRSLQEQGVDIISSDSYKLAFQERMFPKEQTERCGIVEHYQDFHQAWVPGATVTRCEAMAALHESDRPIVLLCYPEPDSEKLLQILEHCHKAKKLVIHIASTSETFNELLPFEKTKGQLLPIPNAPKSNIISQSIEIGYWHK